MAEYSAPPLWTRDGPVTPEDLGLSPGLSTRIRAWAHEWQFGGGEESSDEEFAARGERLAAEVQQEVGPGVHVEYVP